MARARLAFRPAACGLLSLSLSLVVFYPLLNAARPILPGRVQRTASPLWVLTTEALAESYARPRVSPQPGRQGPTRARAEAEQRAATVAPVAAASGSGFGEGYLPVSLLSERPRLLRDISSAAQLTTGADPAERLPDEPLTAIGILLINEHGGVDRLLLETTGLAAASHDWLSARFATARFIPGMLEGRPVRSALRIELQLR